MVGLATDFCVAYSAVDAAKLGYHVRVLLPACRAIDMGGSLVAARQTMRSAGVVLEG
jgi:nicotinamidase/pyrazinamidase